MAFDLTEFEKRQDVNPVDAFVLKMVGLELTAWQRAQVFVTPRVSYNMRTVIERCRKNYYGVFDYPYDEVTGREKFFVPMTETAVENIIKNIDIDTKDINLRAKNQGHTTVATIDRQILRDKLRSIGFGEKLDDIERRLAIDGTVVVKSYKGINKNTGEEELKFEIPDLLNCYIDPQAYSINDTPRFTERIVMDIDVFKAQKGWRNTKEVSGQLGIPNTKDTARQQNTQKQVEVFQTEGMFPKFILTGREEDKNTWFFGRVITSGVTAAAGGFVHKIVSLENDPLHKNHRKSYEEVWYTRVPGRWHGRGIPEKLFTIQTYLNEVVNLRMNNSRVFQTGLFKARRGRGINNRSLQNLVAGGVILVDDLNDIEQFQLANPSLNDSIADEQNMVTWGQKVTNNNDLSGDALPASTPATTVAIANQQSKSAFALIQESLGMFLQRVIEKHFLPILKATTKPEDILRVTGDPTDLAKIDETIAENMVNQAAVQYIIENGELPPPELIEIEIATAKDKLKKSGRERYVTSDCFLSADYDVEVFVTNEDFDKNTLVQNLTQAIAQLAPLVPGLDRNALAVELFDILGLSGDRFIKSQSQLAGMQQFMQPTQDMEQTQDAQAMAPGNQVQANPAAASGMQSPGELIAATTSQALTANA